MASLTQKKPPPASWIVAAMAVVLVVAIAGILFGLRRQAQPKLAGGVFTDMPQAPDFALRDQNGQTVTMSALQGKIVALTFLYTRCPDVCPLIASNLAAADQRLGVDAAKLEMLSVSVDPANDNLLAVKKFTEDHSLADKPNWHYLIGSPGELRPVWQAYHVGSQPASAGGFDGVDHSAMVYLADRTGRLRVILPANFAVSDLVDDVRVLLAS